MNNGGFVKVLAFFGTALDASGRDAGGQGGIRTHGELPPTTVFKTVALNHSATCPLTKRPLASALWDGKGR